MDGSWAERDLGNWSKGHHFSFQGSTAEQKHSWNMNSWPCSHFSHTCQKRDCTWMFWFKVGNINHRQNPPWFHRFPKALRFLRLPDRLPFTCIPFSYRNDISCFLKEGSSSQLRASAWSTVHCDSDIAGSFSPFRLLLNCYSLPGHRITSFSFSALYHLKWPRVLICKSIYPCPAFSRMSGPWTLRCSCVNLHTYHSAWHIVDAW